MRSLEWTQSHAVFVTEIDDEHQEIFEALTGLQSALRGCHPRPAVRRSTRQLVESISGHFAHEERLMRAARYGAAAWHKQQHQAAHKQVAEFVRRIERGEMQAGDALVEYLKPWLHEHTRLADTMLGAFLRNQRRLGKITFRASSRPVESCNWKRANGEKLDPAKIR